MPPGCLPGHSYPGKELTAKTRRHNLNLVTLCLRGKSFMFRVRPRKSASQMITIPRWLKFLIALILGIALGLVYGWVISPVEYIDTAPASLRADYRTDYVLMAAQIYQADQDLDAAARRLTTLGSDPPAQIAEQAYSYAFQNKAPEADLKLLQKLSTALQTWQPAGGAP